MPIWRSLRSVVAGRKRLRIDEVARELAPHRRIFLGWRRSSRSPQYQQGHADLAVLEIGRGRSEAVAHRRGCSRTCATPSDIPGLAALLAIPTISTGACRSGGP